jgi:O-antigen ligase/polysaccharide polymerase Wzy-like membrane protein
MPSRRVTDVLLFAAVFTMSFEQLYWNVAGKISLSEVISILFIAAYLPWRLARLRWSVPRTTGIVMVFFGLFLLVYLIGFYNLETSQALTQFGKGIGKFVLHFAFLAAAIDYLAHSREGVYWRVLAAFCLGVAVNAGYGVLQLLAAQSGHNLDRYVIEPITGHSSQINVYGAVGGSNVYRVDGLTPDPNHLGIALVVPLLVLGPIYLRLERHHRLRLPLALLIAGLLAVELATLSRSGILGLVAGFLVLLIPYRRLLISRAMLGPLALVAAVVALEIYRRPHFFHTVITSRLQRGGRSTRIHLQIYDFVPQVLHMHPLFGLGFNNFSVYYQFVTGKTNWGPHSFYVALLVETGVVGTLLFALFIWYLFRRLKVARAIGRALAATRDPLAARVRPLAWGLTAALVGTMAANAFYLTMTFFYFYALVLLVLAVPVVFGRRLAASSA